MLSSRDGDSRALALLCWIPLASLVGVEAYVRAFDGWGAWASAPLFLVPSILALAIGGAGAVQCFLAARAGAPRLAPAALTGVALLPIFWLMVRRHLL